MSETKGYTGSVTFDGSTIEISHNRAARLGGRVDGTIPIEDLAEVTFKPANRLTNGSSVFVRSSDPYPSQKTTLSRTVVFTHKQNSDFEQLHAELARHATGVTADPQHQHAASAQASQTPPPASSFGPFALSNGRIRRDLFHDYPAAGAQAEAELVSNASKISLGRVATGGVLLGPVGLLLGGLAKKEASQAFLLIVLGDGTPLETSFPAKDLPKAKAFAARVNQAGAYYSH